MADADGPGADEADLPLGVVDDEGVVLKSGRGFFGNVGPDEAGADAFVGPDVEAEAEAEVGSEPAPFLADAIKSSK
jgi:hypothetical protein